ncbi:MAG: hypothetical protein CMJ20_13250 [Phycisphaeraceae bacterium]|nr:hypothetical protein [Phycisphaeraceae bacterium]
MDETATLICRELRFGFESGNAVVDGVNASLGPGRVCALIGPNAAGKSTLLRLMLGVLHPWSGKIYNQGHDLADLSIAHRASLISYVPQHGGGQFAFSVEQVVEMGRYALAPDSEAVDRAITRCDLVPLRHRAYPTLSTGQQQRVLLARAMAQAHGGGRGVMLLDEPVSAMDLRYLHRCMRLLTDIAQSGRSVLVVLHDLNLAATYADDVWLMSEGRLVACGSWRQVLQPAVLEPIYGVVLQTVQYNELGDRPHFVVKADCM